MVLKYRVPVLLPSALASITTLASEVSARLAQTDNVHFAVLPASSNFNCRRSFEPSNINALFITDAVVVVLGNPSPKSPIEAGTISIRHLSLRRSLCRF